MGVLGELWAHATELQLRYYRNVSAGAEAAVNGALGPRATRINPSAEELETETSSAGGAILFDRWGEAYSGAGEAVGAPPPGALFSPVATDWRDWFRSDDGPALSWEAIERQAARGGASELTKEGLRRLRTVAELFAVHARDSETSARDRTYFGQVLPRLQRAWSQWVSLRYPGRAEPPAPDVPPSPPPAPPEPARSGQGGGLALLGFVLGAFLLAKRRKGRK